MTKDFKIGISFPEMIQKGKKPTFSSKSDREKEEREISPWRYALFYFFLFFSSFLILTRLFHLQIAQGERNRQLSEGNRIREEKIEAPRGVIYDRNGKILARNRPIYKRKGEDGKIRIISHKEALSLEAKGFEVDFDLRREYPEGSAAAHLVGYMGEITGEKIKNLPAESAGEKCQKCYDLGDWTGITGAEEAFEEVLKGTAGKRLVETDAEGKRIRDLGRIEPRPGNNISLSLDLSLQKTAVEAMEGKRGAVVVLAPKSGEILGLYSAPSFNPNIFIEEKESILEKILSDFSQPLFNRTVSGLYPPGSTFKIITASAGLESGAINEKTIVEDVGVLTLGRFSFPNWYFVKYNRKEGEVDLVKALQRSNDIFFYKAGEWTGIEKLEEWTKKFGLGKKTGIEIPGEEGGIIRRARDWFLGDTYHTAIGQGDLLVTPLQVAVWTEALANKGKLCRPKVLMEKSALDCHDLGFKEKTLALIIEGLKKACEPGGTGWPLFKFKIQNSKFKDEEIPLACKTGTAEFGDPQGRTHAWFTVFAPLENPEIVVTVLVENGGEGSDAAAPIAKKILEEWFGRL